MIYHREYLNIQNNTSPFVSHLIYCTFLDKDGNIANPVSSGYYYTYHVPPYIPVAEI